MHLSLCAFWSSSLDSAAVYQFPVVCLYLRWRMWESSMVRWPRRRVCCCVDRPSLEMAQTRASITESSRRSSLFLLSSSSAVWGELVHKSERQHSSLLAGETTQICTFSGGYQELLFQMFLDFVCVFIVSCCELLEYLLHSTIWKWGLNEQEFIGNLAIFIRSSRNVRFSYYNQNDSTSGDHERVWFNLTTANLTEIEPFAFETPDIDQSCGQREILV